APASIDDSLEPSSQPGVAAGTREQPSSERTVIESGPASENRQPPARMDLVNCPRGIAPVLRGGVFIGWIGDVDQVVRDSTPLGRRYFVGADVKAAVDGGGIAIDDLAGMPFGKAQRERAFPGRSRAENSDEGRLTH